ncbi:MAG: PAS domain S-box protein, partial [Deltaproteobacteria bacterium]
MNFDIFKWWSPKTEVSSFALLLTLLVAALTWWFIKVQQVKKSLEQRMVERAEELQMSEDRFRSFVESANDLIYTLSPAGIITYVAPNVESLLGYLSSELIGSSFTPIIHEDELPLCITFLQQVFETGTKQSGLEYRIRHKNGNWLWFVSNASLVTDAATGDSYFLGIGHDITSRKLLENDMRESDELLAQFMQHSPVHTYVQSVTPTESRTLKCSESFQQMLGLSSRDILGKTMEELFPPELAAKITADNWAIVTGGKAVELDEELNGRYYTTIKFPIVQRDRTLLAGYTIDVTERTLTEETMRQFNDALELGVEQRTLELRESKSRFDQLAEQSGTIVWEIDTEGLLTYISHVSEIIFGYHPDEVIGKMHFYDMHPESVREAFKEATLGIMERKEPLLNVEHTVQAKEGRTIWVSTSGIPILSDDGTLLGYRGSYTDITESKKLKEQLI